MTSYAVIGASRGLGLEFIRQLANRPNATVFAVVRNARTSTHLTSVAEGSKNVHIVEADVVDYKSLERAAKQISEITGGTLDCLIHNAALIDSKVGRGYDDYADMDELDAEFTKTVRLSSHYTTSHGIGTHQSLLFLSIQYQVNTLGAIHSIFAFLPLLRASSATLKKIVVISSAAADYKFINTAGQVNTTAYGITKAATVLATTKWAVKLKDERFVVVSLSPGMADTSGTSENDPAASRAGFVRLEEQFKQAGVALPLQTTEESVSGQLKVIDELKPSDNGLHLAHTGGEWKV
ncbi:NAD-P-binding protein [Fomes fomentarius]|nr:NAD-P-binding protein [Fomes fomentarius]